MCMSDKSRDAWPDAIADDDASLLWFDAKSSFLPKNCRKLLYQRTTGSSKRITMCSTTIHANADAIDQFRPRTNHLLREHRLFNQMLGSSSRINNINILLRPPWRHRKQHLAIVHRY